VGEIAQDAGLYADSLLDELAARKLRFHHPDLARQWDALQQQQTKAALQNLQPAESIELDQGRTRSLGFPQTPSPTSAFFGIDLDLKRVGGCIQ
jgi:hypothetical protein